MASATALARKRARRRALQRVEDARRAALASLTELQTVTAAADDDTRAAAGSVAAPPCLQSALYALCLAGREPAEALPTLERGLLITELHGCGWTDRQIAAHTRETEYTIARIRHRLGLPMRFGPGEVAIG